MAKKTAELTNVGIVLLTAAGLPDPKDIITPEQATKAVTRYKELESAIEAYTPLLKDRVFAIAEVYGIKDEKGNIQVVLPDGSGYKKEIRQTVTVDHEKAVELFRAKGMGDKVTTGYAIKEGLNLSAKDLLAKVAPYLPENVREMYFDSFDTVPDEDIEEAYLSGKITDDEMRATIAKKVVPALREIKPKKK